MRIHDKGHALDEIWNQDTRINLEQNPEICQIKFNRNSPYEDIIMKKETKITKNNIYKVNKSKKLIANII
jgi:hypothetical protein